MPKRVIITGGAGFIGSHTAEEFLANGYEVVIVDNLRSGSKDNLTEVADRVTFIEGDIRDKELLTKTLKKGDIVIHLAAFVSVPESIKNPEESHDINVTGSNTLYVAANEAGASRVITASSAAIYGEPQKVPISEDHRKMSLSPYALHKNICEDYGKLYSTLGSMPFLFPRFFNVYGPRQSTKGGYAAVIPVFAEKIKTGEPATIEGDGTAVRDFIYVKDVARALRLAAEVELKDSKFEAFNIGAGKPITINELWQTLCKVLDKEILPVYGPARVGDIHTSLADVSKAKSLLNFEAETSFEDGLRSLFK